MAICVVIVFKGDLAEMGPSLAGRGQLLQNVERPGLLSFTLARCDDGMMMIEQWESQEHADRALELPVYAEAEERFPLPAPIVRIGTILYSTSPVS